MSKRSAWWLIGTALIAQLLVSTGCSFPVKGEDLGGGFKRVSKQSDATPGAGRVDHLYYGKADLGAVGYVSVAPSGRYAIFERSGSVFLIASGSGNLRPVMDGEFAVPRHVHWREAEGYLAIEFDDAARAGIRIGLD